MRAAEPGEPEVDARPPRRRSLRRRGRPPARTLRARAWRSRPPRRRHGPSCPALRGPTRTPSSQLAATRIHRPLFGVGDNRVGVGEKEKRSGRRRARGSARRGSPARVPARRARTRRPSPRGRRAGARRHRLVPGRVDGVEPQQLLEEPDRLVAEGHGRHVVAASILRRERPLLRCSRRARFRARAARGAAPAGAPGGLRRPGAGRRRRARHWPGRSPRTGSARRSSTARREAGRRRSPGSSPARPAQPSRSCRPSRPRSPTCARCSPGQGAAGGEGRRTILFLDEIHRFNKAQQDALLPAVESGLVTLIGATTENPYFEVNSALLSRTQVYELQPLERDEVAVVVRRGAEKLGASVPEPLVDLIATKTGGDARSGLNILELAWSTAQSEGSNLEERHVEDAASGARSSTTRAGTPTTTSRRRSSSRSAAPTPTPRSTTSRRCSRAARIRASSRAG